MSEFKLCFLQQGAADKAPMFPIFGFRFEESQLVLFTATVASKSGK